MKKLLTLLLIMTMSLSLFVGCGGSNDGDSDKGNATNNEAGINEDKDDDQQDDENDGGEVTMTYGVTDYETGNTMDCELTYNSSVLARADEIFDDAEPVTSLTEGMAEFFHIENGASYAIIVIPHCGSAQEYYSVGKDSNEDESHIFSELTTQMVGDIETKTYTQKIVFEDGDTLDEQYWLLEFEDGVMIISTYGDEEELSIAQDSIKDLLMKVTLNGKEAGMVENTYTLYDYNTGAPLYTVTYNPKVFSVDPSCDPASGELILNYADTSKAYTQMIIHVNEFASGDDFFNSKKYYSGGINYYEGDDGNYLETEGEIGDATVYIGLGLQKGTSGNGYVFFAEMPDGNVITGNVPGSYVGDVLDIYNAFIAIQPVE